MVWAIAQNSWFSVLLVHLKKHKYISSAGKYIHAHVSACIIHLHLCEGRIVNMSFQDQGTGC